MLDELGRRAKVAARQLSLASTEDKNKALKLIAENIRENSEYIIKQNALDMENGHAHGMSASLLDRLMLNEKRINDIADSIGDIVTFQDPVGRVLYEGQRPNGLKLVKVSTPIGVIAVIYEARPNVTVDSAVLCLKSGNSVILRGGKEAINSNIAITEVMRKALEKSVLPVDIIQIVTDTTHKSANELMHMNEYVDVLIPRGGKRLIDAVVHNSTVPVIETGSGVCQIYVDKDADLKMAADIIYNAKTSRPSVCNAAECILIHKDVAEKLLPLTADKLKEKNVEIRADAGALKILGDRAIPATESDWGTEFNDYIIAAKIVESLDEALNYIYKYSTGHSECIITENKEAADKFLKSVDAAAVYHNASTRFTDGGVFGLGAEIGISTQKLHARGPLGLNELTSMKYLVYGNGQIR